MRNISINKWIISKEGNDFVNYLSIDSSRVNISNKYLCTNYQKVYEFAQISIESKKSSEILEPLIKLPDWEEESKGGNEFLSGKKESTTASRSPNSDVEKKEHEEMTKSAILDIENSKNPSDIRSYFIVSDASKVAIKQESRESNSEDIFDPQDNKAKIISAKCDKKRWTNEIQKNWITSYFT